MKSMAARNRKRKSAALLIRLHASDRERLPDLASRFGYESVSDYVRARLFAPLGVLGAEAMQHVWREVNRLERRALDGEPVTAELSVLRMSIERYLSRGADPLFARED
jgi:hypothetical protein